MLAYEVYKKCAVYCPSWSFELSEDFLFCVHFLKGTKRRCIGDITVDHVLVYQIELGIVKLLILKEVLRE